MEDGTTLALVVSGLATVFLVAGWLFLRRWTVPATQQGTPTTEETQKEVVAEPGLAQRLRGQMARTREVLQGRFMSITGITPIDFRQAVHDKEFLGGVLDFLLGNETDLLKFCEEYQIDTEQPSIARRLLPGYTNSD